VWWRGPGGCHRGVARRASSPRCPRPGPSSGRPPVVSGISASPCSASTCMVRPSCMNTQTRGLSIRYRLFSSGTERSAWISPAMRVGSLRSIMVIFIFGAAAHLSQAAHAVGQLAHIRRGRRRWGGRVGGGWRRRSAPPGEKSRRPRPAATPPRTPTRARRCGRSREGGLIRASPIVWKFAAPFDSPGLPTPVPSVLCLPPVRRCPYRFDSSPACANPASSSTFRCWRGPWGPASTYAATGSASVSAPTTTWAGQSPRGSGGGY